MPEIDDNRQAEGFPQGVTMGTLRAHVSEQRIKQATCTHEGYESMTRDGRHCPNCGMLMTDFGD